MRWMIGAVALGIVVPFLNLAYDAVRPGRHEAPREIVLRHLAVDEAATVAALVAHAPACLWGERHERVHPLARDIMTELLVLTLEDTVRGRSKSPDAIAALIDTRADALLRLSPGEQRRLSDDLRLDHGRVTSGARCVMERAGEALRPVAERRPS